MEDVVVRPRLEASMAEKVEIPWPGIPAHGKLTIEACIASPDHGV